MLTPCCFHTGPLDARRIVRNSFDSFSHGSGATHSFRIPSPDRSYALFVCVVSQR